jgi:hypothetical protein
MSVKPSVTPSVIVAQPRKFCSTLREIPTVYVPSVILSVIVAQSSKFFSTLCEIPTGYVMSVILLVIVAQSHNCFSTLCEIPTTYSPSVKLSIFLIFLCIPVTKSWIAILQHNNKSWPLKKNKYFMFQNITL